MDYMYIMTSYKDDVEKTALQTLVKALQIQISKQRKRTPKESPEQHKCKCCTLGLIELVHGW